MCSLNIGDTLKLYIFKERSIIEIINRDVEVIGVYLNDDTKLLNPKMVINNNNNPDNAIFVVLLLISAVYGISFLSKSFRKDSPS